MEDSAELEALWHQASELEEKGEIEEARGLYERCIELEVKNEHTWIQYAGFLQGQEQWREAIEAAEHATSAKRISSRALAFCLIGSCYRELGQYSDAEQAYRQSIAIQPYDFSWVLLFNVLSMQDREDESIECLHQALHCNPDYDEAHYNLGCHYSRRQEYDLAECHLRRALEIDPQYARAFAELGWLIYGRALKLQKEVDQQDGNYKEVKRLLKEAQGFLQKAFDLDESYVWGRVYLGSLLDHTGSKTEAEEHYQAALKLWPDSSMPHWLLGDFLSRIGDHAQAGQLLKRALELADGEGANEGGTSHYYLGMHYQRRKRIFRAKEAFREAARQGHERAQKLLDEIESR